ncbi:MULTISPECIES: PTS fructose transporter subunit IIB [Enterococcus]|uniref:PTS fructose transporter subunit IIB n=1 Tax=Enterococcus TaxID=1350 RepID=UPI001C8C9DA3|nr:MULTISPECIES: PTS fructose transporter subunit IIB [Enterococcus]MBX8937655.1 PTS fructose transporter subunit IIB [Enterococcus gilvus]MDT2659790.1 PTS fructose transporter subunit IIB [Enterococcus hulanensis]
MYKILSICGSGIATSTLVAERLKDGLEERGIIDLAINEANINEAAGFIQNNPPHLIIYTTSIDSLELNGIPSFDAIPILMNLNTGPIYDAIAESLRQL